MSGAINTKGLNVWMSDAAASVTKTITGVTPGDVSVVAYSGGSAAGLAVGALVTFSGTGMAALDGKTGTISVVTGTTAFTVLLDTTGQTFAASTPVASVYSVADMVKLCLSNVTPNPETPGTISVGTYCDPTASLPSAQVNAGTATLDGYVDPTDAGYIALLAAIKDGEKRWIEIELPQSYGYIVFPITLSTITWGIPIDGAISFTANGTLASAAEHQFDPTP